jgi:hypothetical protein
MNMKQNLERINDLMFESLDIDHAARLIGGQQCGGPTTGVTVTNGTIDHLPDFDHDSN